MLAYLDELGTAPDLHGPVGSRLGEDQRSLTLPDRDPAPEPGGQPDGVGPGRLVFSYAVPHREHPCAHVAGFLVIPGPHPGDVVTVGRTRERVHLVWGTEPDVLELWRPLGSPGDVGGLALDPDWDLAGGRAQ